MSKITQYYEKRKMKEQLARELEELENDKELKQEIEFKEKLKDLMSKYGKSAEQMLEVMAAIEPKIAKKVGGSSTSGSSDKPKRALKTYRNPHTGEVVETRGGNQKTLKQWKEQYGKDEVESWLESVK